MDELTSAEWTHVPDGTDRRLVEAARRAGLLDVAYCEIEAPMGSLVAATTPRGLVRLSYAAVDFVLDELARRVSPRVLRAPAQLDPLRRELDEYFGGRRRSFDVPLDWTLTGAGFARRVLEATCGVPFGHVSTYREVALEAGNAAASRAAGNALAGNPLCIVVPCHRVLRADLSVGGYAGGPEVKEYLLRLEGSL